MNTQRIVFIGCLMVIGLLPLACGIGTSQATPNLDATVQAAIAQTRTFEGAVATSVAATAGADTPATVADTPKPTATNVPATTPTDTPQAPTPIPPSPSAPTPTPTEEKLLIAESDADGNDGNDFLRSSSESNQGRVILLPGFDPSEVTNPMVFRDRMVFQVEVFDTRYSPAAPHGVFAYARSPGNTRESLVFVGKLGF